MNDDPEQPEGAEELAEILKKHGAADPATVLRAKRAFEAVLEGDRPAMAAIASEMAPPAPANAPSFPAPGRGKQASSGVWIAVAAGALAIVVGAGVGAYKLFHREPITATPCGKGALQLIGSLKSPVTVTLYATKGLRCRAARSCSARETSRSERQMRAFSLQRESKGLRHGAPS